MIRLLAIIAGVGALMSVVCISVALAIGGPEAITHGAWSFSRSTWGPWSWSMSDDDQDGRHHWSGKWMGRDDRGASASRDFPWAGGGDLVVNAPAEIDYVQAPGPAKLSISGPAQLIGAVQVRGGEITLPGALPYRGRLHITLRAPGVHHFALNGAAELDIKDYDQDQLTIDVSGHADVEAQGRTRTLALNVSGAGEGDFDQLRTAGADIDISGAGKATVGPTEWAKVQISGLGDVQLLTRPPHLQTNISGAGHVRLPQSAGGGPAHAI